MIKVYEYPNCTTCKRAKKFLKENNINAEFINIKETTPSKDELKTIASIKNLKKLFNTSGKSYKDLDLKNKINDLSLEDALNLLVSDGMLIKRPVLIDEKNKIYLIGFKEEEFEILVKK